MAGTDKADHPHPRRDRRDDARHAVFDNDAALRHHPHAGGGMEKEIGRRLAAGDLGRAEDVRVKAVVEADERQGVFQPLQPAARGDADAAGQRIEHRGDIRDCPQFALEQRPQPHPVPIGEIRGKRPMARFEIGNHAGKADPGIAVPDLVRRKLDATFREAFLIGTDRQQLAVDQDAVAIEDDEIEDHVGSLGEFGLDDDDRDIVGRATRQHIVAQPKRRLSRRRGGQFLCDLGIADDVGQPVAA
jgi:hypothetical protein